MIGFIVYALPRSRTYWLSRFLTHGGWVCGHDEMRRLRSVEDISAWFKQPLSGTVETAGAPWWRTVERMVPGLRTVTVRRDSSDVIRSLLATGIPFDLPLLHKMTERIDRKLDQIEKRVPNVLTVTFNDLQNEATCAAVYEHCTGMTHDSAWFQMVSKVNLQANLGLLLRYYAAHAGQIERLGKIVKQREIAAMQRRSVTMEGITFQQEPFQTFLQDSKTLFHDHLSLVGEPPEALHEKNIPLMQKMDEMGLLQVTTARSNGRMFGYLMAVISPSLEARDVTSAVHTTFFASPLVPGIGMKLQRASVEALRARGVKDVLMRAGTRGMGPKMGALYRRMGAEFVGSDYLLPLTVH